MSKCILCGTSEANVIPSSGEIDTVVTCQACGKYCYCRHQLGAIYNKVPEESRYRLSAAVRRKSELDAVWHPIEVYKMSALLASVPQSRDVQGKARFFLESLAILSNSLGDYVNVHQIHGRFLACANKSSELEYFLDYCSEMGWVASERITEFMPTSHDVGPSVYSWDCVLTPSGWEHLRTTVNNRGHNVFVAMMFSEDTQAAWNIGIRPAVEDDCHWRAERIDLVEHNDDIVDRILGDIRGSRFLVADFTGHRNGVYFEAGFALGLGIPVIWVCRKDAIEEAHFDTSHFSHVIWETPEELREKLANRIRATIGKGNYKPLD